MPVLSALNPLGTKPLSPRHAGIRGHHYCVVLPDHVSAALTRRHVAAKRRMMRAPGPYRTARRLILMTFPGGFKGSSASSPRRADLETSARPHTPGLTRMRHQLGRIASTFPDVGLCSRTSVRLPVPLRDTMTRHAGPGPAPLGTTVFEAGVAGEGLGDYCSPYDRTLASQSATIHRWVVRLASNLTSQVMPPVKHPPEGA